jgi:hypothetical protein
VYVFAFSNQYAQHLCLTTSWGLRGLSVVPLARFFAPLFQCQIQIKGQHLWEVLVEVLAAADLSVLELVEQLDIVLRKGIVQDP